MICRVCDGNKLEKVLDLGNQPWCNHFLKPEEVGTEPTYPLRVVFLRLLLGTIASISSATDLKWLLRDLVTPER